MTDAPILKKNVFEILFDSTVGIAEEVGKGLGKMGGGLMASVDNLTSGAGNLMASWSPSSSPSVPDESEGKKGLNAQKQAMLAAAPPSEELYKIGELSPQSFTAKAPDRNAEMGVA